LLEIANGCQVLVHAMLIGFAQRSVQSLGLIADEVEHAAALFDRLHIRCDFIGLTLHEQLLKQLLRATFGRDRGAAAREA
jgi:hypothetical protein